MSFRMDAKQPVVPAEQSQQLPPKPALADPKALLQNAVAAHQAGQFDEARRLYLNVLDVSPEDTNALTNMGALLMQTGNLEEGLKQIGASLAIRPSRLGPTSSAP